MGGSDGGFIAKKVDNKTQQKHKDAIAKLKDSQYNDGTYDIDTLSRVTYDNGYQVTFCQIGDNYSPEEYADKVNEFASASSDGKTSAGKFGGEPEISFHVDDRKKAEELARKYNQVAIHDWKTGDDIYTGGTGRRE